MQTIVFHYTSPCVIPDCMCVGADVALMLKGTSLTEDGKPYVRGTITIIEQTGTNAYDVTIEYDESTLGELVPSFGVEGTCCDPVCITECSWLWSVMRLLESATGASMVNRHYTLYDSSQWVADGVFDVPRIPFATGYRLSAVHLTCFRYDENTIITAELRVGSTLIASYTGPLDAQAVLEIDVTDIAYDEMPVLTISGTDSSVYEEAALGLVLELIGIIIPA